MTSYSVFVPESNDSQDVDRANLESFLHGAARGLLDTAECLTDDSTPEDDETREAEAVWWHSARLGWEVDAIAPEDRQRFRDRVSAFVEANRADIAEVALLILADAETTGRAYYVDSVRSAWYRAGELFPYTVQGAGVGLWEYGAVGRRLADAAGRGLSAYAYPDNDTKPYAYLNEV